jgi:hypothetical protein
MRHGPEQNTEIESKFERPDWRRRILGLRELRAHETEN